MRIRLSIIIAITTLALVVVGCSQADAPPATATTAPTPTPAKMFTSQAGGFSAAFPEDPQEDVQTLPTDVGEIEVHFLSLERENAVYMIVYSDYPTDVVAQSDPESMLNGARDGAVSNVQGTLVSEEKITIDDHPGRGLKITSSDGEATIYSNVYLVNNRLYQIMVVIPSSTNLSNEASNFLNSFKLI